MLLAMIDELEGRVNRDLEKDVIALWHDESHINRYFIDREFDMFIHLVQSMHIQKSLMSYCKFEPKIVHLAKDNSKYQQ